MRPSPDPAEDKAYLATAKGCAGAALGSVLAGLPILWGQVGVPFYISVGLAIFWAVSVISALARFGPRATILLASGPFALLWPLVGAWLIWGAARV